MIVVELGYAASYFNRIGVDTNQPRKTWPHRVYHVVMTAKPAPSPRDLKTAGTSLWRRLVREFEYNSAEMELLHQLCVTVDEIAAMRADLSEMGMITMGSKNQPVINPLLNALVAHRKLADQLVTALGLPVQGEAVGRRRSAQGKAAADARWRRTKKLGPRGLVVARQQQHGGGA